MESGMAASVATIVSTCRATGSVTYYQPWE
jgi:hypothetical protein